LSRLFKDFHTRGRLPKKQKKKKKHSLKKLKYYPSLQLKLKDKFGHLIIRQGVTNAFAKN